MSTLKTTNLQNASAASPAFVLAADGSATANLSSVNGGPIAGSRNRIINGDMRIDQRNAGASITLTVLDQYSVDRWQAVSTVASKYSLQRNAGAITPPASFTNYLGMTSLSAYSVLSGDAFLIRQGIEGFNVADFNWGAANAQTVTVSFWVRSSLTGAFGGSLYNDSVTRSYPFSYTISAANTWEQKTVTVAGDTTGTWTTDNTSGINLRFSFGAGTTYSGTAGTWSAGNIVQPTGSVSVVGTNGATLYITGVQLEPGTVATPFERISYSESLARCQRYYQKYLGVLLSGYNGSGGAIYTMTFLPVEMRVTPTFVFSNFTNSNCGNASINAATTKLVRFTSIMTATAGGFSLFDVETSGAEL